MKGGDGMSLLYRPLTVPGPFKDEPDGAVTTSQEGGKTLNKNFSKRV